STTSPEACSPRPARSSRMRRRTGSPRMSNACISPPCRRRSSAEPWRDVLQREPRPVLAYSNIRRTCSRACLTLVHMADEQTAIWNGRSGEAWVESQALLDDLFKRFEALLVDAVA